MESEAGQLGFIETVERPFADIIDRRRDGQVFQVRNDKGIRTGTLHRVALALVTYRTGYGDDFLFQVGHGKESSGAVGIAQHVFQPVDGCCVALLHDMSEVFPNVCLAIF